MAFAKIEAGIFLTAPASFISAGVFNDYILSFLCSKVGTYFVYQNSDTTGAGDIMLNIQSLIKFPIPIAEKIDTLDDSQIYSVYGLAKEEIEFIESSILSV